MDYGLMFQFKSLDLFQLQMLTDGLECCGLLFNVQFIYKAHLEQL